MRRVLTIKCTRPRASGGWPVSPSNRPSISAAGKSTPGGTPKTRGDGDGSNISFSQHILGKCNPAGMANVAPCAGIAASEKAPFLQQSIPDFVEGKSAVRQTVQRAGADDLRAGINQVWPARGTSIGAELEVTVASVADCLRWRQAQQ